MRLRLAGGSLKLKYVEGVGFLAISDQLSNLQFHVSAFFIPFLIERHCESSNVSFNYLSLQLQQTCETLCVIHFISPAVVVLYCILAFSGQ